MNIAAENTSQEAGYNISVFRKSSSFRWALKFLGCLLFIAFFAPLLANEKPFYMRFRSENYFPAFTDLNPFHNTNYYEIKNQNGINSERLQLDIIDWKKLNFDAVLWCPIPYSAGKSDYANSGFVSPFAKQYWSKGVKIPLRFRHFLGTGVRGEDVLAGLIHGTRISMSIGVLSMLFASLIGIFLGTLAGYFGDNEFKCANAIFWLLIIGSFFAYFYAFYIPAYQLKDAFSKGILDFLFQFLIQCSIFLLILLFFYIIGKFIHKKGWSNQYMSIPLDSILSRSMDILVSLPIFILIISISAITKPSIFNLIFILAITSWTGIARLTRAELLRIKKLDYIQAAKALGFSQRRIIFSHALSNGIAPALVAISFGVASTILIESSLSFLGIGMPIETVTWGAMLNEGRHEFSAWWMTLFPGLAIFACVTLYNFIGDGLRKIR